MMGDMIDTTYEGKKYRIPEAWLVGYTHGGRHTFTEAIAFWAMNQELAEREARDVSAK